MNIFNKNDKINFVDDNDVFVGLDSRQACGESFGYFFSYDVPSSVERVRSGMADFRPDSQWVSDYCLKHRQFNPDFMLDLSFEEDGVYLVIFELVTDSGYPVYLTLFNNHNGYYSHGFSLTVNGVEKFNGYL